MAVKKKRIHHGWMPFEGDMKRMCHEEGEPCELCTKPKKKKQDYCVKHSLHHGLKYQSCLSSKPKKHISDVKPFEHGEEGTHYACPEASEEYGNKVLCCHCSGHKCKPN